MAGQKKSCKQPGFAHPHVQALLSEGDHCLGDRGPEKALVVQGRYGVQNNDSSRQMRALSGPCPPDKETLNEVLEWHWWHGGRGGGGARLLLGPQATSQAQGAAVCPPGPGQRAPGRLTSAPPLCAGHPGQSRWALPAPSPKAHLPLTKPKNK